ncbi:MAG TPA: NAD-glutamate dehydrogenase, partial [Caulobacteraceae bacterium]
MALTYDTLAPAFAKAASLNGDLGLLEKAFVEQALDDYVADETPELDADSFAALLAEFWAFGDKRPIGDPPRIRIRPARVTAGRAAYDLVEVVQDDGPFLVDSVMGELSDAGVSVQGLYHPVLDLGDGRRESMILVVVDRLSEDRRAQLLPALEATLDDVRLTVRDHGAMLDMMRRSISALEGGVKGVDAEALRENLEFLRWLKSDRFVFLGARDYDYPRAADGGYAAEAPLTQVEAGLGVLSDPDRPVLRRASEPAVLTAAMRRQLDLSEPVTVAKANLRSRVHRRAYMDYVGVKRYDADGRATGETRFVGLFTAEAYDRAASEVPLIRRKVANALVRAGKTPGGHNEKRLKGILENYPRDELFQMSEDELLQTALGVLHLYDRPRVRMFTRKDPFDRFVSVLLYVPRERYDAGVRERAGALIARAWGGRVSAFYPQLSDQPLVRIHFIIGVTPGAHPEPDLAALEQAVAASSRSWADRFDQAARDSGRVEEDLVALSKRWAEAFPAGYRDRYSAEEAVVDVAEMAALDGSEVRVRAFRNPADTSLQFRFKLYRRGAAVPLADVLPILGDMGLKALEEFGHAVLPVGDGEDEIHIHEFLMEDPRGEALEFAQVRDPFEEAFIAVWSGRTESDGFNRLVLELGVDWRQAALVRALARYRSQTGLDPSQALQEEALREHPQAARLILALFAARFDPAAGGDAASRGPEVARLVGAITEALQGVASLDHDRVLRRLYLLVQAIKRTNFYQADAAGLPRPHISFKVASRELEDVPAPKPYREIYVWAPHVEGVHLRFGPVARGGLRWSDRRDDFRTEVLGLVKAQQVKNAVIVPVGSKGGFYPKQLPRPTDREAWLAEGKRAYVTFLSRLLDITDNLDAKGKVVRPAGVVAWEDDDPYLVVAADKGTATFSDLANSVSESYGFWLGDAFASGGSAGYDHKVMGITARGAWEAVKRHFREMGKDIQSEPFTAVGVGDMSGDVFGNGMLLSKQTRLIAAFDHRDIFIDPNPDPAASWIERKRMFELPRSSWQDYDKALISAGGGVFPRAAKSIALTPEIKAILDIQADELAPNDLIRAILMAPVELLYLGGIGTYVKAPSETHQQVGDKGSDAIRVDANELRVKVVGEGANLGLTQAGRIAFARGGGRINTDAIDNSAGVDSSDHEVNIKILTGALEAQGLFDRAGRNALLASMTEEVGLKVLAHNYDQTLALTLAQAGAAQDLESHSRFMIDLELKGRLDRKVEGLPLRAQMAELAAARQGLTRPELAVLLAYSKLELSEQITASRAVADPFFERTLVSYFPAPLAKYEDAMRGHRLRPEIIATVLANDVVNVCGATFPSRLMAGVQCDAGALVIAFEAARRIYRLDQAWDAISALDGQVHADVQTTLYREVASVIRRQTFRLAFRAAREGASVQQLIDAYRAPADALRGEGAELLNAFERSRYEARAAAFVAAGAPEDLARSVAMLWPLASTTDIADLARETKLEPPVMARLYFQVGEALMFDRLRAAAGGLASDDHFERIAVRRLGHDLSEEQAMV